MGTTHSYAYDEARYLVLVFASRGYRSAYLKDVNIPGYETVTPIPSAVARAIMVNHLVERAGMQRREIAHMNQADLVDMYDAFSGYNAKR